jgi:hypothetical protein
LGFAIAASIFFSRCIKCFARLDSSSSQIQIKSGSCLPGGTFEQIEFINTAIFVAALLGWEIKTPRSAIGKHHKWHTSVKGIFKCLPNGILCFARLFDLDEYSGLRGWMAKSEISAPLASLIFRPDNTCVPRVPPELLQDTEDNPLGDGLFVWETALAKAGCDVRQGGF